MTGTPATAPLRPLQPPQDLAQRLASLDITPDDTLLLRQAWPLVSDPEAPHFEAFHQRIMGWLQSLPLSPSSRTPDGLRHIQYAFVRTLFCSDVDPDYVQERLRVGQLHHRIGLEPHWYLGACHVLQSLLLEALETHHRDDPAQLRRLRGALQKRFALDMGLIMNAYVHTDRAALEASNRSLYHSQLLLQQAQELAQLACWELHLPEGHLTSCERARALLHLPADEAAGVDALRRWVHPQDRAEVEMAVQAALATQGTYDIRYRISHPAHPVRMMRERGRVERHLDGGVRLFATLQDISLQVSQLSRIEQLALYDDLTGLPNRAHLMSSLEGLLARSHGAGGHLALLFIDLDDFKEINDTQGHGAGDSVLVEVARRLKACVRGEELVARLGGDEFVVVARGVDRDDALAMAHRVAAALAVPQQVGGTGVNTRASIGIALYPEDGETATLLLRNADTAMYAAKRSQSGVMSYRRQMHQQLVRRVQMASRLTIAVDNGDFQLHFQPQVRLADGRLTGAEALLRWHDPHLGTVSPAAFIGLAEERGLIGPLGNWVIDAACRQLRQWQEQGTPLPGRLAVNVSPRQFDDPQYARRLLDRVLAQGIAPGRLDLELTETGMMADPVRTRRRLGELRQAGFALSLDDFGMGYSSLAHLKDFPLDCLKLDRSFISGMLEFGHDYAIVRATLAMAEGLELAVMAEGVETAAQARALAGLGCRLAQGYHFGMPVAAHAFASQWLSAASPA